MHTDAPPPPTKKLLLWTGIAGGLTSGMLVITLIGLSFNGIPTVRLTAYFTLIILGIMVTGWLGSRYHSQRNRRNSWWEGFAAGDEPLAEVIPLRDLKGGKDAIQLGKLKGYEGNGNKFVISSPS
ncbi:hypothetical protein OG992_18550 [Micromonospora sp. NBC_00362]|uniref:hypothetical protein n=1 Tax=Micromonospora sp. NBC_00362 TaxID=2975975 RepID=UPI002251BFE2|nr:hypothetical protein [Micromonospora sp. NBC_00362]MCX5119189.1 hypothetical protein [Micromonospora sp. NBC_00362]